MKIPPPESERSGHDQHRSRERRNHHQDPRKVAEATDAEADPDRRAWHLAQATSGPGESVRPSWSARLDLDARAQGVSDRLGCRGHGQPSRGSGVLLEICRAVRALPPLPAAPHPLDLVLDGLALLTTDGRAVATPSLQRAAKAVMGLPVEDVVRWGWLAPAASSATWDCDGAIAFNERKAQLVRDAGALAELPLRLHSLALEKSWLGDFASAGLLIAESDSVAAATGSQLPVLRLRSLQGREAEASALIEATIQQAAAGGQGIAMMVAYWGAAVLFNGLARYQEAASAARQVTENAIDPWESMWALPELVEAAARVGDTELAREALERLAETTQPSGVDVALGIEARSRAPLTNGDNADLLYREAIERLGRTQVRPELARAQLLYGEWLRREGRRGDAREQLRTAHDLFAAIGMESFAERTSRTSAT